MFTQFKVLLITTNNRKLWLECPNLLNIVKILAIKKMKLMQIAKLFHQTLKTKEKHKSKHVDFFLLSN